MDTPGITWLKQKTQIVLTTRGLPQTLATAISEWYALNPDGGPAKICAMADYYLKMKKTMREPGILDQLTPESLLDGAIEFGMYSLPTESRTSTPTSTATAMSTRTGTSSHDPIDVDTSANPSRQLSYSDLVGFTYHGQAFRLAEDSSYVVYDGKADDLTITQLSEYPTATLEVTNAAHELIVPRHDSQDPHRLTMPSAGTDEDYASDYLRKLARKELTASGVLSSSPTTPASGTTMRSDPFAPGQVKPAASPTPAVTPGQPTAASDQPSVTSGQPGGETPSSEMIQQAFSTLYHLANYPQLFDGQIPEPPKPTPTIAQPVQPAQPAPPAVVITPPLPSWKLNRTGETHDGWDPNRNKWTQAAHNDHQRLAKSHYQSFLQGHTPDQRGQTTFVTWLSGVIGATRSPRMFGAAHLIAHFWETQSEEQLTAANRAKLTAAAEKNTYTQGRGIFHYKWRKDF